jgi:hypothetical protein
MAFSAFLAFLGLWAFMAFSLLSAFWRTFELRGTVQPELRWVKIGINRTAMKICIAGKCRLPCPKGHHHERSINLLDGCNTF